MKKLNLARATDLKMQEIGKCIKDKLPTDVGFFVLIMHLRDVEIQTNYISDCNREDVINVMKKLIIDWEEGK